ncbi:MAG: hypothetical protein ACYC37_05685 [Desulfobacteria bacterium]
MRRKAAAFEGPFDRKEKMVPLEGLPDKVVRATLRRLDGRLYIAEGRDDEVGLLLGFWLEARSRRFEMERYTKSSETLMMDIRKELQERIEELNKEKIESPR